MKRCLHCRLLRRRLLCRQRTYYSLQSMINWLLRACCLAVLRCRTRMMSRVAGESLRLARDFGYLCETEFPAAQTAEHVTRQYAATRLPSELHHRRQMILATKCVLPQRRLGLIMYSLYLADRLNKLFRNAQAFLKAVLSRSRAYCAVRTKWT